MLIYEVVLDYWQFRSMFFANAYEALLEMLAKEWPIKTSRAAILHVSAISPQRQKKAKKTSHRNER